MVKWKYVIQLNSLNEHRVACLTFNVFINNSDFPINFLRKLQTELKKDAITLVFFENGLWLFC